MSRHWTGIALELAPTGALTRVDQRARLRLSQLGLNLIGLKRALVQALGLSLLLQLFAFAATSYLQLAVDNAIPSPDTTFLAALPIAFPGLPPPSPLPPRAPAALRRRGRLLDGGGPVPPPPPPARRLFRAPPYRRRAVALRLDRGDHRRAQPRPDRRRDRCRDGDADAGDDDLLFAVAGEPCGRRTRDLRRRAPRHGAAAATADSRCDRGESRRIEHEDRKSTRLNSSP